MPFVATPAYPSRVPAGNLARTHLAMTSKKLYDLSRMS